MSNNERDKLAKVIVAAYGEDADKECPCEQDLDVADAILAAGYRNPRTITTPDELASLPDGSVLMSGDRIKMYAGAVWRVRGGMVEMVGREARGVTPFKYFIDPLPATVLHEPSQP